MRTSRRALFGFLFLAVATIPAAPVFAGDPPPARGVAGAAPRKPESRTYTNADLPSRPEGSVIGSDRPAPSLAELQRMLPPAPPAPEPEPDGSADDQAEPRADGFRPPGFLIDLIGARGSACLYGKCPDGRPPLAPLTPWSGARARRAIREIWSRPVVSPVTAPRPAPAPRPKGKPATPPAR